MDELLKDRRDQNRRGDRLPTTRASGPGGLIEDLKLGLGALIHHHSAFKRIAVVSDKDWVAHALHAFAWMVPGELAAVRP